MYLLKCAGFFALRYYLLSLMIVLSQLKHEIIYTLQTHGQPYSGRRDERITFGIKAKSLNFVHL